jgi:hypothetical protein
MGTRVKDSTGSPAFALVNKATGQALRHAPADLEQVKTFGQSIATCATISSML